MSIRVLLNLLLLRVKAAMAVVTKFANFATIAVYQADADTTIITTVGTDTYVNNKVDIPLTLYGGAGGIELDVVNKWIINNSGMAKKLIFDAVATVSSPSANNTTIHFAIFVNGTEIQDQTVSFAKLESLTGATVLNAASMVDLDDGDYIEVYCKTNKTDASFTADHIQLRFVECSRLECP